LTKDNHNGEEEGAKGLVSIRKKNTRIKEKTCREPGGGAKKREYAVITNLVHSFAEDGGGKLMA